MQWFLLALTISILAKKPYSDEICTLSFQVSLQPQIKQFLHLFILFVKSLMSPCNVPGAGPSVGVMVGSNSLQGHWPQSLLEETDLTLKTLT